MDKRIAAHKAYISEQLTKTLSKEQRQELFTYHTKRVRDFQHERLIHLLVTFFFGFLFIGACIVWLLMPVPEIYWLLTALVVILFGLELAYIRYYYLLENGVQGLYAISEKISKIK